MIETPLEALDFVLLFTFTDDRPSGNLMLIAVNVSK